MGQSVITPERRTLLYEAFRYQGVERPCLTEALLREIDEGAITLPAETWDSIRLSIYNNGPAANVRHLERMLEKRLADLDQAEFESDLTLRFNPADYALMAREIVDIGIFLDGLPEHHPAHLPRPLHKGDLFYRA